MHRCRAVVIDRAGVGDVDDKALARRLVTAWDVARVEPSGQRKAWRGWARLNDRMVLRSLSASLSFYVGIFICSMSRAEQLKLRRSREGGGAVLTYPAVEVELDDVASSSEDSLRREDEAFSSTYAYDVCCWAPLASGQGEQHSEARQDGSCRELHRAFEGGADDGFQECVEVNFSRRSHRGDCYRCERSSSHRD